MTKDEWKKLLKESFPDEVQGYKRGDTVPSDVPYMEEFPPFITKDKVVASLNNLVIRQMLSNDKQLKAGYESADKNINDTLTAFKSNITAKRAANHTLTLQGDVTGSATFNNDSNITVTTTDKALNTFKTDINAKRAANHTLTLKGDVTGSATFNNDSNITVTTANKTVAKGMIVMWYGNANAVPNGWALCNGSNGTPDLRNRFIIGAGSSYGLGATGGEVNHTLTYNEMPSHKHIIPWGETGSEGAWWGTYGNDDLWGLDAESCDWNNSWRYTSPEGGGQAHNNMPPYYGLYFIMKL